MDESVFHSIVVGWLGGSIDADEPLSMAFGTVELSRV